MTELIVTRGLPASGKTTRARAWVGEDPAHRARVNKDDFRRMLHDGVYLGHDTEGQITAVKDAAIARLLERGVSVVNDDTNLPQRNVRDLYTVARKAGAEFTVWDMTDVPVEVCLERDALDGTHSAGWRPEVGEKVIRGMWSKYLKGKGYPMPLPAEDGEISLGDLYEPKIGTMRAIVVDIDGTVALKGTRSPFDETRVHEDRPNFPVVNTVVALFRAGFTVLFVSGRTDGCRDATREWLEQWFGHDFVSRTQLWMRKAGDTRDDRIVKREIFDEHIRNHYTILAVFDDRNRVVKMWRDLGLAVFHVAEGDF